MRYHTNSNGRPRVDPASLSQAFAKAKDFELPAQGTVLDFFGQASQNASSRRRCDYLLAYWSGLNHYDFSQKSLSRVLKGLKIFLESRNVSESVRDFFKTGDALQSWYRNLSRFPHSLATDYLVEDLITFHDMGITPDHSFLNAFENNITIKRLTPELLEKVSEILAGFNCALNPKLGMELAHG